MNQSILGSSCSILERSLKRMSSLLGKIIRILLRVWMNSTWKLMKILWRIWLILITICAICVNMRYKSIRIYTYKNKRMLMNLRTKRRRRNRRLLNRLIKWKAINKPPSLNHSLSNQHLKLRLSSKNRKNKTRKIINSKMRTTKLHHPHRLKQIINRSRLNNPRVRMHSSSKVSNQIRRRSVRKTQLRNLRMKNCAA